MHLLMAFVFAAGLASVAVAWVAIEKSRAGIWSYRVLQGLSQRALFRDLPTNDIDHQRALVISEYVDRIGGA